MKFQRLILSFSLISVLSGQNYNTHYFGNPLAPDPRPSASFGQPMRYVSPVNDFWKSNLSSVPQTSLDWMSVAPAMFGDIDNTLIAVSINPNRRKTEHSSGDYFTGAQTYVPITTIKQLPWASAAMAVPIYGGRHVLAASLSVSEAADVARVEDPYLSSLESADKYAENRIGNDYSLTDYRNEQYRKMITAQLMYMMPVTHRVNLGFNIGSTQSNSTVEYLDNDFTFFSSGGTYQDNGSQVLRGVEAGGGISISHDGGGRTFINFTHANAWGSAKLTSSQNDRDGILLGETHSTVYHNGRSSTFKIGGVYPIKNGSRISVLYEIFGEAGESSHFNSGNSSRVETPESDRIDFFADYGSQKTKINIQLKSKHRRVVSYRLGFDLFSNVVTNDHRHRVLDFKTPSPRTATSEMLMIQTWAELYVAPRTLAKIFDLRLALMASNQVRESDYQIETTNIWFAKEAPYSAALQLGLMPRAKVHGFLSISRVALGSNPQHIPAIFQTGLVYGF